MPKVSLRSFDLKLLALLFMLIDHIGAYFPAAPEWFRWLGRIAFPLFLFCLVWSYHYTHSRWRFLLRLYLMSLFMAALRWWLESRWPTEEGFGNHNIFVPMLLTCLLISTIEAWQENPKRGALWLGGLALSQLLYFQLPVFLPPLRHISGDLLTGLVPNLALCEFGFEFVALGVAMYFLRERPRQLAAVYLLFCLYQFNEEILHFGEAVQFWMALALPFMLAYNQQRGPGLKWFFYVFYPAHLILLFWLANFVLK